MILMRFGRAQPLTLLNARVVSAAGVRSNSLHIAGGRVAAMGGPPVPGARVVDLDGAFVYPGLVNAHDHLELNNFPRLKWARAPRQCARLDRRFSAALQDGRALDRAAARAAQ